MASYATVEQYRVDTLDESSGEARVTAVLEQQSAKLRATLGIGESRALSGDAATLARLLVTDAARKQLVPPSFEFDYQSDRHCAKTSISSLVTMRPPLDKARPRRSDGASPM